jgi:hypothetical protein
MRRMISPAKAVEATVLLALLSTTMASEGTPLPLRSNSTAHVALGEHRIAARAAGGHDARRQALVVEFQRVIQARFQNRRRGPRYSAAPSTRITSAGWASSRVDCRSISMEIQAV